MKEKNKGHEAYATWLCTLIEDIYDRKVPREKLLKLINESPVPGDERIN
jgi:hypothetical protein